VLVAYIGRPTYANYVLAMKQLDLSGHNENGRKVEPYEFFAQKGF